MNAFLKRWFPSGSTDRWINLVLLLFIGAGAAWLWKHSNDWPSLEIWWSVLSGENTEKVALRDYMRGGWLATSIVWIAGSLALLGFRGLVAPVSRAAAVPRRPRPDRRFLLGLLLIVILAVGLRWPRLGMSLYNDEVDVFRTCIAGEFDRKAAFDLESEDIPKFFPVSWQGTVWGNRIGNNHALHSITARIGYDLWKEKTGAVDGQIREWPLRLPPLLGGLVSIAAVGFLTVRVTGNSLAGLLGSLFLAVHPWHIRYTTEARGYGLLFAFAVLSVLFLLIALENRRRYRWWTAFGLVQAGCLWSYLGSAYLLVGLNIAAMGILFVAWRKEKPAAPLGQATFQGWVWANALTLLLLFLLQAPNLAQLKQGMSLNDTFHKGVGFEWLANVGSYYLMGMPWHDYDIGNTLNPALSKYVSQPIVLASLILATALAGAGAVALFRRSFSTGMLLVAAPLIAVGTQFTLSYLNSDSLLTWYVVYVIVFAPMWMAAGVNAWVLSRRSRDDSSPGIRRKLCLYAILIVYLLGITPAIVRYRKISKQALRPAIELIRGGVYPFEDEQLHPITCGWWTHANFYDPTLKITYDRKGVNTMIQRSRTENRPLFFVLGMRSLALKEDASVIDLLEKSGQFEVIKVFPGLEESQFRTTIYRLLP